MPEKKRPKASTLGGPVLVILEGIRSHNRAALETVSADIRQVKAEVGTLKEPLMRLDAVITADYRERLHRLEEKVEALERRPA